MRNIKGMQKQKRKKKSNKNRNEPIWGRMGRNEHLKKKKKGRVGRGNQQQHPHKGIQLGIQPCKKKKKRKTSARSFATNAHNLFTCNVMRYLH